MSAFQRERYRKKLQNVLSRADDPAFFDLVWSVRALQTHRVHAASQYIRFPPEAASPDMFSQFAVHAWDLESVIGQLLVIPKYALRPGRNQITDCTQFGACAAAVHSLRKLENAESQFYLK